MPKSSARRDDTRRSSRMDEEQDEGGRHGESLPRVRRPLAHVLIISCLVRRNTGGVRMSRRAKAALASPAFTQSSELQGSI
jgi:hypothetical protein